MSFGLVGISSGETRWWGAVRDRVPRRGLAGSLALHALVASLIAIRFPWSSAPPEEVAIPVDLVVLSTDTESPPEPQKAAVPLERASGTTQPEPPRPLPARTPPPPATALEPSKVGPRINPLTEVKPATEKVRRPAPVAAIDLHKPADTHRPAPVVKPSPGPQAEAGLAKTDAAGRNAAVGPRAVYSIKDYLRAEIERRWNFDVASLGNADVPVSIHIVLSPSGAVNQADIVDDPRYASDPRYRSLAISARDAVLVSSPLQLPPGVDESALDLTLTLDPRDALR